MLRILSFHLISLLVNLLLIVSGKGAIIIRDSEIEEVIEQVVAPLKQAANLPNLKIHIINDHTINAFTPGGDDIFIHSGLITEFPNPDILRGVIAHEIGHIKGHHLIRGNEVIQNYQKAVLAATILGLGALATNPEISIATTLGATHLAERSILAYSRSFESSADQVALKLLDQVKHSAIGMATFFKKVKIFSANDLINPYEQTHPLSEERLAFITNHQQNSAYRQSQNNPQLVEQYKKSAAKLWAFTSELKELNPSNYKKYGQEASLYVQIIKNFRVGNFAKAIEIIDQLINKEPKNAYYHELKGQIYHEFGRNGAIEEYKLAKQGKPTDILIRLGLGIAGIDRYRHNVKKMQFFAEELNYVLQKEPNNLTALYYLVIYYKAAKMQGETYLTTALISLINKRPSEARKMAKLALNILPKYSTSWYKADDILTATK